MQDTDTFANFHKALMELSHSPEFINRERRQKLAALTALCAKLLEVERVSIWQFPEQRTYIESEWLHTPDGAAAKASTLYKSDSPDYFSALQSERVFSVPDAQNDLRTRGFTPDYLRPMNISSMLDAPVLPG